MQHVFIDFQIQSDVGRLFRSLRLLVAIVHFCTFLHTFVMEYVSWALVKVRYFSNFGVLSVGERVFHRRERAICAQYCHAK